MPNPDAADSPPTAVLHPLGLGVLAVFVLAFAVAIQLGVGGGRVAPLLDEGGQWLAACFASVLCAGTTLRQRGRERVTWALLTTFSLLWTLGQSIYFFGQAVEGRTTPSPSIADLCYFLGYPLAICAVVRMASPLGLSRPRLRTVLDALILGGSLCVISWAVVLERVWNEAPGSLDTWMRLASPVADLGLIFALLLAWPRAPRAGRLVLSALVVGLLAGTVADSFWAISSAAGAGGTRRLSDAGWVIGLLTIGCTALLGRRGRPEPSRESHDPTTWRLALPYVPLLVALLVSGIGESTGHAPAGFVQVVGFAVVGLVVLRQVITLTDNLRLTSGLQAEVRDTTLEVNRFRAIVDDVGEGIFIIDPSAAGGLGQVVDVNTAACRMLGYQREELLRLHPSEVDLAMAGEDHRERWLSAVGHLDRAVGGIVLRARYRRADGEVIPVEGTVRAEEFAGRSYVVSVVRDVTERTRTEDALRESERTFRNMFDANPQPMWVADRETDDILAVNDAAIAKYGYARDEFLRLRSGDLRPSNAPPEGSPSVRQWLTGQEAYTNHQLQNGDVIEVEVRAHPLEFGGRRGTLVLAQDVTSRRTLERRLRHQAYHHPLTNLANRTLLYDRVRNALDRHRGRDHMLTAVLLIDLDGFKSVNDTMGHAAGDEVLIAVAARLIDCLRPGDTAAHIGGDEFAVLLEVSTANGAEAVAWRICEALRIPLMVQESEVFPSASVGLALGESPTTDADTLLRDADVAMYAAKTAGKNRVEVFDRALHEVTLHRLELRGELRRGLERGEFLLEYQPIIGLEDGRIRGLEALVRWDNPGRGRVPPADFIGLAEETGHIVPLGAWVLREACRQAKRWNESRPADDQVYISVNVSTRQLREPNFVDMVVDTVAAAGIAPTQVVLEVTEGAVVDDMTMAQTRLNELRGHGFRIAMDDFGAGYSSLAYLRDLPIDIVKIDRMFVAGVGTRAEASSLISAIVRLLATLDVEMVAEGVETVTQLTQLRDLGVHSVQGYLLSRPLAVEKVDPVLARGSLDVLGGEAAAEEDASPVPGSSAPEGLRILIADGDPEVRRLLSRMLTHIGGFTVVGDGGDLSAVVHLAARLQPDVVLLDAHLPGAGAQVANPMIRSASPAAAVVLLSESPDGDARPTDGARAFDASVPEGSSLETLVSVLRRVGVEHRAAAAATG